MTRFSVVSHRSRVQVEVQSTLQRLVLESDQLAGEFEATVQDGGVDPQSVTAKMTLPTPSLGSGNWLVDRDVRNMLEARKYSEISGQVIEVKSADGSGNYWVRGMLRLHGVAREVQGKARLVEVGDRHAVFEAEMKLDFTLFNLAPPKLIMLRVEPEVLVRGRMYAEQQS
jgi:polyisoprenoid-binding protein YceI